MKNTPEVFFTQEKRKRQRFSFLFEPQKAEWRDYYERDLSVDKAGII